MKKLLSIMEAGALIGLGRDKMYSLVRSDPDLPTVQVGCVTKINKELLDEYLEKKCKIGKL